MTFRAWALAGTASIMALSGIVSASAQTVDPQVSESQPTTGPTTVFLPPAKSVPLLDDKARDALRRATKGEQRIDAQRDRWRNPEATLQFFGVLPTDTVVEIWPGQGWYTSILGPYLKQGNGKLIVGHFDAAASDSQFVRQMVDGYRARFAADPAVYGNVNVVPFGPSSRPLAPPNSVDKVLTFRNIHNWMAQSWAEKAFSDFYTVLKPGGILGIEEHRGRTDEPQDPLARDGYVREDYVIQLAREAGFEFIGGAEINANPADTKDHPFGVWTLPPVSRTSPIGLIDDPGFDRSRYDQIGESDRMTLRFRKPLDATGVGLASSRPTADQIPVTIIPGPPPPPPPPRRGRRGAPPPAPPGTPVPAPVVAGAEVKPATSGTPATPIVDAKEGGAAAGLRPTTEEPQAKAPPPPASPPPPSSRRGSSSKARTPTPPPAPAPTPAAAATPAPAENAAPKPAGEAVPQPTPADAKAKDKPAAEPAASPTPTTLRSRQRGTAPAASKAGETTEPASPSTRSRTRSGTAPAEEAKTKAATPASRTKAGEEAPPAANRRSSRRPAAEPADAKAPVSKSKSKAKAAETETTRPASSRNRNRPETKAEPKKKASSTPASSSRTKAAPKAAPAKKSPPPAKANPNKPDWVVPPKKKKD
ncbi:MAG: hypothetical protein RL145_1641 [Pseudomonadota bacterium]